MVDHASRSPPATLSSIGRRLRAPGGVPDVFRLAEHTLYVAVGVTLAVAAFVLFGQVIYEFLHDVLVEDRGATEALLTAVDGLLLVFIFAELLHTVRVVVRDDSLRTEPFLVVGIVAAIRRFLVAGAEAAKAVGDETFGDLMLELGVLMGAVLILGVTIWLLRRDRQEPPSSTDTERIT